ncbi:hypothetical protein AOLI_G00283720 [Acnodon oligacanthus]
MDMFPLPGYSQSIPIPTNAIPTERSADDDPVGFGSICGRLTHFSPRPRPTASCPEHMCGGRGISDHRGTGQGNTRCCSDTSAGFQPLSFLEHMLGYCPPLRALVLEAGQTVAQAGSHVKGISAQSWCPWGPECVRDTCSSVLVFS